MILKPETRKKAASADFFLFLHPSTSISTLSSLPFSLFFSLSIGPSWLAVFDTLLPGPDFPSFGPPIANLDPDSSPKNRQGAAHWTGLCPIRFCLESSIVGYIGRRFSDFLPESILILLRKLSRFCRCFAVIFSHPTVFTSHLSTQPLRKNPVTWPAISSATATARPRLLRIQPCDRHLLLEISAPTSCAHRPTCPASLRRSQPV